MLPLSFWAVIALLVGGGVWSFGRMNDGTGLPMLAVLGTATAWYVGDVFYNDYPRHHVLLFDAATLENAWWQVAWFLTVFLVMTPVIHQWMNRRNLQRRSGVLQMFKLGVNQPELQKSLNTLFWGCASVWFVLFLIAIVKIKAQIIFYLFPFLGHSYSPWSHGRIGAGLDFLDILAVYLELLVASMFGVVAALATDRRVRSCALLLIMLTWPYFIFDRTRNSMLAITIPAVLSWVFLRLRGGMLKKILLLLVFFLVVNTWMKFVIANRDKMSITAAFEQKGLNVDADKKVHNAGLNMYEELCWVSTFIDNGTYHVNWGERYFAELVNPIPRALWPGKPLIGIDYAIARGMSYGSTDASGVVATVSTGFIGQGVVNFGRFLGPLAAALLMSFWAAWLARLDLNIHALGRLPLYALGMILTFNLGRDITLITLYPFLFGRLAVWWLERHRRQQGDRPAPHPKAARPAKRPHPTAVQPPPFARRAAPGGFVNRGSAKPKGEI